MLPGVRFAALIDAPEGRLNMDMLKSITTGDKINAKRKFQKDFEFKPCCKLAVGSNPRLTLKDTGAAVKRRIRMVPFDYKVTDDEKIPFFEKYILKDEAEEILSLLIFYANQYYKKGEGPKAFPKCSIIDETSAEYLASEDLVGRWKEERTEVDEGCTETVSDLYQDFRKWVTAEGVQKVMGKSKFSEYLVIHLPNKGRTETGVYYSKVRLKYKEQPELSSNSS
jgi:putative DNA primase/helicase